VDVQRFADELPGMFDAFPGGRPVDARFAEVLEAVPGLAKPNNLALLNLAARLRGPDESYVEIGTFRGTSLIAALLDNDGDFVAIDSFQMEGGSREHLEENLARFGLDGRATVIEGDAFELLRGGALDGRKAGVYYYDAFHEYEAQLEGLRLAEPHLADEALLIVDDSDWERVARATHDYVAEQPRARLLFDLKGKDHGFPDWWEGVHVLAWNGSASRRAWRDIARRRGAMVVPRQGRRERS
jgi:protein O-GlcNAc transferase